MYPAVKPVICVFLLLGPSIYLGSQTEAQQSPGQGSDASTAQSELALRISIPKTTFELGATVPLRVELHNVGEKDIWLGISNEKYLGMPVNLRVFVRDIQTRRMVPPEGYVLHESPFGTPDPGEWWVRLPSGYFYGRDIELTKYESSFVDKAGRYEIAVRYEGMSRQHSPPMQRTGKMSDDPDRTSVVVGRIESNSILVDIVPTASPKSR